MKSRGSIGDMLEILLISEHFDHEKKTVPAYIRGFDLFEPPKNRFCLWKAASFTRF